MPNLAKFGSGGSRAFGFRGKVFKLFTQTFTSSQNFTVPNGVTRLLTFSGKAQDGSTTYDIYWTVNAMNLIPAGSQTTTVLAEDIRAEVEADVNSVNSGNTTWFAKHNLLWVGNQGARLDRGGDNYSVDLLPGSAYVYGSENIPLTGPLTPANCIFGYGGYGGGATLRIYGADGAGGSAFGINLPGGAAEGGIAPTITQSNVAVNANQTYSLNIPSGGSVTITYLA